MSHVKGRGETTPTAYFYQNLGEAEYVVAVYQYMRLLGYPAEKVELSHQGLHALTIATSMPHGRTSIGLCIWVYVVVRSIDRSIKPLLLFGLLCYCFVVSILFVSLWLAIISSVL